MHRRTGMYGMHGRGVDWCSVLFSHTYDVWNNVLCDCPSKFVHILGERHVLNARASESAMC